MSAPMSAGEPLAALPPHLVPRNSELRGEGRLVGPKWPIAMVAMVGALISVLDVSILNVALPSIRASLGASLQETSWIATGYMVSNVVVIPLTGFFQRRIGFQRYFVGSIILFTIASVLCAFSWNLWSLVFFRVLQGLGGGALIPTASSMMLDRFPRSERGMAMAVFGMGAMMGPMLGPSIGGWLTDQFSWHMIFLINVPIGILEVVLATTIIREDRTGIPRPRVDWWGIAYLAVWLGSMQYLLEEGNTEGWFQSPEIRWLGLLSVSAFALFVEQELSCPYPIVNLRLFKDRMYTSGTLVNMGLGMSLFGGIYLYSLYCGVIMNYTASQTGSLIFSAALIQGFTMPIIGRLGDKVDRRILLGIGMSMTALSLYQYTRYTGLESRWDLLYPQLIRASSMGMVFVSVGTLALDRIAAKDVADATGLFNLTREVGGSIGTATLATIVSSRAVAHQTWIAESIDPLHPAATSRLDQITALMSSRFPDPERARHAAEAMMSGLLAKQSLILAFDDAFAVATSVAAFIVLVVVTLPRPSGGSSGPSEAH